MTSINESEWRGCPKFDYTDPSDPDQKFGVADVRSRADLRGDLVLLLALEMNDACGLNLEQVRHLRDFLDSLIPEDESILEVCEGCGKKEAGLEQAEVDEDDNSMFLCEECLAEGHWT